MLAVNQNRRYLLRNGRFYPYLADTAWTMIQRLNRREICYYLDKRAQQGFNAVQVSALSELDGVTKPNREGFLPFENADVSKPQDGYFSLVQFVADQCAKRNMVLVLLPTWGDKFNLKWGTGPEIFTPDNAYAYGKYLARVIADREDVIWMLGGDRPLETSAHRRIIDEMARGLKAGETVRHLMTYHPCGEASSADFLADADYIDYHSVQSGHSFGGFQSEQLVRRTLNLVDKPCMDAECFYEDFPLDFNTARNYRFAPSDIRRRIYRNLFSGSAGHTYGHQSVWCFRETADGEYPFGWVAALDRPAAQQMQHVNRLLSAVDITASRESDICRNSLAREGDGFCMVYAENKDPVFIDLNKVPALSQMRWFNPVTGELTKPERLDGKLLTAESPFSNDAVLLLEA